MLVILRQTCMLHAALLASELDQVLKISIWQGTSVHLIRQFPPCKYLFVFPAWVALLGRHGLEEVSPEPASCVCVCVCACVRVCVCVY